MLDNPMWNSLATRQAPIAQVHGGARRYPPAVAPFAGVGEVSEASSNDLRALISPGEKVGILSVIPSLDGGWTLVKEIEIHQYAWPDELQGKESSDAVLLGEEQIPAMIELTTLVYPAYFRPETARLGDYFGVLVDGRLAAMAGIRMSMDGYQELSAICTHPDFRGRGFARALTQHLVWHVQQQSDVPFLHTEFDNSSAKKLYESMGFLLRAKLPFRIVERV